MRRWALALCSVCACALNHSSVLPKPEPLDAPEVSLDAAFDTPDTALDDVQSEGPVDATDDVAMVEEDALAPDAAPDADDDAIDASDAVDAVDARDAVDASDASDAVDASDASDAFVASDAAAVRDASDVVDAPAAPAVTFTLATSGYETTAPVGGNIGDRRAQLCNANEVLVGLRVRWAMYAFVYGLAARCAVLRSDGTLGAVRELGYNGPTWPVGNNTDDCPAGAMVVGLVGRSGAAVDRLGAQCAPIATWLATRTVTATTPGRGGNGGTAFTSACPAGFVGRGVLFDEDAFAAAIAHLQLSCVRVTRSP